MELCSCCVWVFFLFVFCFFLSLLPVVFDGEFCVDKWFAPQSDKKLKYVCKRELVSFSYFYSFIYVFEVSGYFYDNVESSDV